MTNPVPTALADTGLVIVDVEGNGHNPPEIIELAALPVRGTASRADMRTWLIKPARPIVPTVTKNVHGIKNSDVANCPAWSDVASEIATLLGGRVLVAHGAHVELRVIGAHLPDWQPPMVLDTLRLAKYVWPGLRGYGLGKLVEHADLDLTAVSDLKPHRAAYDTWCAWQLLRALVEDGDLTWFGLTKAAAPPGYTAPTEPGGPSHRARTERSNLTQIPWS